MNLRVWTLLTLRVFFAGTISGTILALNVLIIPLHNEKRDWSHNILVFVQMIQGIIGGSLPTLANLSGCLARWGPAKFLFVAFLSYAAGYGLAGLAILFDLQWLFYFGLGVGAGVGLGE
jgi:hypothetical protein